MLRLKALFRARGIRTPGKRVYHPRNREEWLAKLKNDGARFRAQALYAQLDVLRELRPKVKAAMVAEARRDPAWEVLKSIPFLGPVRVALILAILRTPWRFRTKRNLWAYCGLNRNHNRELKNVFKGAATAATGRPGPLKDYYEAMIAGGMREELARVTLTCKLVAVTLRLWKKGENYDPAKLTVQAH
jgi:transposase